MVKIRLSRAGAKKRPFYHIIAIDSRKRRDGRPLEHLGTYEPGRSDVPLTINLEGIEAWVSKGAQISDTVSSLMRKGRQAPAASA